MNKRALLIAIVAAVVGSLLLFLYLRRFEQDMSGGDRIRLLVTVKPIERNATITEDMLTEREVPVAYVEDRAVKRQEKPKVVGLRVGTALQANQTLMWTDLAIATDERRDLSSLVQPGNRAVTVRALGDDAKSGALITPGDYVDVVATMPTGNGTTQELQSIVLLQRILVLAVGLDTTADTRSPGATDAAMRGNKYARDLMLTLSINVQEAQLIALAQDKGKLSVALRNPDDQRIVDGVPDMSSLSLVDKGKRNEVQSVRKGPTAGPVNLGKPAQLSNPMPTMRNSVSFEQLPPPFQRIRTAFAILAVGAFALTPSSALAQPKGGDKKPAGGAVVERSEEVNIAVGENKTVGAADTKSYSEGLQGIADAKLTTDKNQFVITGQKPGTTTLLLIKNDGSQVTYVINVFSRPPIAVERELEQLLEGMTGLRVRRVGARFFIEGGVSNEADARKIGQIAALYPGQVESLVQVGTATGADRKFNIRLDFFFVQFQKTSSYQLGISYPSRIGGEALQSQLTYDFIAGATTTAQASIQNQALPGLDIAARAGWARVMKQSTVITANGTEATFENGGEQNFQVSAGLGSSIQAITFGTKVVVLPRYDQGKRELEVALRADVADLTPPRTGATVLPGRQTAKLSTLVHMRLGQSLILSGIRTRSHTRDSVGLPLLSEIPVLGALFGTQASQKEDVEGAVFIVPSVVESASKGALDMIKAALSQYQDYSGDLDSVNLYNKKPPVPTDDK